MLRFFSSFFQISQIPRCLTLKQRLQTRPMSHPETSQVGRCLHLPACGICAGELVAGAGMQEETGSCGAAVGLCSWCEKKAKKRAAV